MSITFEVTMPVETVESLQNNAMYLISLESTKDKVNVIKNLMEVGRCVAIAAKKLSYKDETFTAAQLKVLGQENKKRMEMARKDENRDEVGRGYFHHYHLQDLQSLQELFEQQHKERLLQARQEQELKEANQEASPTSVDDGEADDESDGDDNTSAEELVVTPTSSLTVQDEDHEEDTDEESREDDDDENGDDEDDQEEGDDESENNNDEMPATSVIPSGSGQYRPYGNVSLPYCWCDDEKRINVTLRDLMNNEQTFCIESATSLHSLAKLYAARTGRDGTSLTFKVPNGGELSYWSKEIHFDLKTLGLEGGGVVVVGPKGAETPSKQNESYHLRLGV